jgi:hypothetical protein
VRLPVRPARTCARSAAGAFALRALSRFTLVLALACPTFAAAQEEGDAPESSFTVNALMKLQGGLFVPLLSSGFSPHENRAVNRTANFDGDPCDPILTPREPCSPRDHGQRPGTPSITRATLQLEAHWDFTSRIALHAIVRGTRSMELPADEYAQVPTVLDRKPGESDASLVQRRKDYAKKWVRDNQYNTFELREFYVDLLPTDWLVFRVGRQQVAWGETGSFRLLDVVNPINSTWHFSPLESFEDQRVPLWMLLSTIEVPKLAGALDALYIPGLDRARDTVSTPLSMGGAWGVPYSNEPSRFLIRHKDFQYPGGKLSPSNMRYGVRWKGDVGSNFTYSLVYMYTHMQTPVVQRAELALTENGAPNPTVADRAVFTFPRQHIAGLSLEYTFPSPVAATLRFEGAYEPNRSYSARTDTDGNLVDGVMYFPSATKHVLNYALVLQRPTMIRWLNPTQNFLMAAQFQHTTVLDLDEVKDGGLVQVLGYNDWRVQKNAFTTSVLASTQYLRGLITPRVIAAYVINPYYEDSGFISFDVGFRIGPHYRVNVTVTDFIAKNAYRDLGLFRDRDEIHVSATALF